MDPKATWPVVKFIIAATGFRRREARQLLDEIPQECYSDLFLKARAWDRDAANKAGEQLSEILGHQGKSMPTLTAATKAARFPSTGEPESDDDDGEETPRPRKRKRAK